MTLADIHREYAAELADMDRKWRSKAEVDPVDYAYAQGWQDNPRLIWLLVPTFGKLGTEVTAPAFKKAGYDPIARCDAMLKLYRKYVMENANA